MKNRKTLTVLCTLVIFFSLILSSNVFTQDNSNTPSQLQAPRIMNPLPPTVTAPLSWNSRAFAYNAYGSSVALGPFKMWLVAPLGITSLATDPLSANFVQAGCFANGIWYGARYSTNALVSIDTSTGVITTIATITGASSITGLAWDAATSTMYASDYSSSANKLGTLNLTTGVFTPLSGVVGTGLLIDIACSNNGTIYGHMITAPTTPSQIYSIDKTTGVGTIIGTTGFNANYAQGMSWDHSVDTGYLAAYNYTTSQGELRKINIATGNTTLVGAIGCEGDGFIIPGDIASGVTNNNSSIPEIYSLEQNFPNPFNPETKISFSIPKNGFVTLKIYDILGKEVAMLVNEVKNPGNYTVEFNASTFSSGTYFYKLESNGFMMTKKMMVLK
jgi:hypothetical protein